MTFEQAAKRAGERTASGALTAPRRDVSKPTGWTTMRVKFLCGRGKHGQQLRGELVASAKLTEAAVLAIRAANASGISIRALAREYSVSRPTIKRVVTREYWKHVA
jgi:hypothetical protein